MKPSAVAPKAIHWQKNPYNIRRAFPRMSWHPINTFNIWQRTAEESRLRKDMIFTHSSKTMFQQRWMAKAFLQNYHADVIRTKIFERWYVPMGLPSIHVKPPSDREVTKFVEGKEKAGGRTEDRKFELIKQKAAHAPVNPLMFAMVERRLDVCAFRCCFAQSIYEARGLVIKGKVKLNGQIIRNPNILLNPGDIFSVDPKQISFLQKPREPQSLKSESEEESEEVEESEESEESAVEEAETSEGAEASETAEATEAETAPAKGSKKEQESKTEAETYFHLPPYAQTHIFVPPYLLPSYLTCSAVYVRHPTARANYSEIASPFDAQGDLSALAWEWFKRKAPRMRPSRAARLNDPQQTKFKVRIPRGD